MYRFHGKLGPFVFLCPLCKDLIKFESEGEQITQWLKW